MRYGAHRTDAAVRWAPARWTNPPPERDSGPMIERLTGLIQAAHHPRIIIAVASTFALIAGTILYKHPTLDVNFPVISSILLITAGLAGYTNLLLPETQPWRRCTIAGAGALLSGAFALRGVLLVEAGLDHPPNPALPQYLLVATEYAALSYMTFATWSGIIIPWASLQNSSPTTPPEDSPSSSPPAS